MDQDSGVASGGSFISLNEHEQRYYSGLHSLCQADTSGNLSSGRVAELFKASQLPPGSLHKVTEVCGAKRLGYFGVPQFYVALKLLAAAQAGLPIRLESVTANLPLPRFAELKNEPEMWHSAGPPITESQGGQSGTAPGSVSWAPSDRSTFRHPEVSLEKKESWCPLRSPSSSPPPSPLTYCSYLYSKQRNGADSQITYEGKPSSQPMSQLEQHSSPSNYRTKPTVEHLTAAGASSAEQLEQQGVVDYSDDDPWRITEEQLEYYTNQFKSLQPDLGALILGGVAKNFFTKSKLPIPELSHIWELSDVDRDGALTFFEFCIAFHLIVARKNGYPLPESLPRTLRPEFMQQDESVPETPESVEHLIVFEDAEVRPSQMDQGIIKRIQPSYSTTKQDLKEESCRQDASLKRVTTSQEKRTLQLDAFPRRPEPPQELEPQMRTRTRPRSYSSTSVEDAMKKAEEPPTPPPRPQKTHSRASSLDLNKLLQQGAPGVKSGWLPPPPALPPRPSTSQVPHFINTPEKIPLNKVQQPNFADFSLFKEEEENNVKSEERGLHRFSPSTEDSPNTSKQDVISVHHNQAPQKPIRKKYHAESQNQDAIPPPAVSHPPTAKPAPKLLSRQRREIQMAIRKNKETNAVLTRLNSELQQQLKVVHQERVTLESQLELLRPLTST
ncbi:ralBP1-associated Eps domain-containing protein 2 isoform X2 [Echeneis naucrates]|uniref:RALBP1 associated Eps domain containing 2 n=1 Tax=Echeneis naucrates TaxID=173247 RepID=A0A665VZJ0_ECHNA|nr:ralBP1-associated Eps domain-containing protein 2 isoform X2 [Echeneis naucrates]